VQAIDVNGDHKADVVASNSSSNSVSVYFNNGDETFGSRADYSTGTSPWGIAAGDLDGDGLNDIVTANFGAGTVSVLRNSGGGILTRTDFPCGGAARNIAVADIDGDGKLDIIAANVSAGKVSILVNGQSLFTAAVSSGWNMSSLPVLSSSTLKSHLFPTATSASYIYRGGYLNQDTLRLGNGFWIKFAAAETINYVGTLVHNDTIPVSTGWNMIGSISDPVDTASIVSAPSGIVRSNYYGYGAGYLATDSIRPGFSYWVKAAEGGSLILHSPIQMPRISSGGSIPELGSIVLTDNDHQSQTLYFRSGTKVDAGVSWKDELPPVPPKGVFDARFEGSKMTVRGMEAGAYVIEMQSAHYPVRISWRVPPGESGWSVVTGEKETAMRGEESIVITKEGALKLRFAGSSARVPERFALNQNYPNPFNPTTTISYNVAAASSGRALVSIKIYGLLGEVLGTLVDELQEPGRYTTQWNAQHVGSGVYYLQMRATDITGKQLYIETKKLLVMK
jgi:hypothetical protein